MYVFSHFFVFALLLGLPEIEKSWEKRVSECNSGAIKAMEILPFWKLKAFTHTPHAS